MFAKYHYLNHNFNKAAHVYVCTIDGNIAGMCAVLPFPHPRLKRTWKEHRTVVLPDYQGIGIGSLLTDSVAQMYLDEGKNFVTTTSNPAFIHARCKSPKWIATCKSGRKSKGSVTGKIQNKYKEGSSSNDRITVSFKYKGLMIVQKSK